MPIDTLELTKIDITVNKTFQARQAAVYGITLGITQGQAKAILKRNAPNLSLERDPFYPNRYYLNEKIDTSKITIAYFKWLKYEDVLSEMDLYPSFARYMKGLTCSLLTEACLNPDSEVYKRFLGKPASEVVDLDIPSVGLKVTRYFYSSPRLIMEKHARGADATYNIILYNL